MSVSQIMSHGPLSELDDMNISNYFRIIKSKYPGANYCQSLIGYLIKSESETPNILYLYFRDEEDYI